MTGKDAQMIVKSSSGFDASDALAFVNPSGAAEKTICCVSQLAWMFIHAALSSLHLVFSASRKIHESYDDTPSNIMEHNSSQLGLNSRVNMFPVVTLNILKGMVRNIKAFAQFGNFLRRTCAEYLLNQTYQYETTLKYGDKYVCV